MGMAQAISILHWLTNQTINQTSCMIRKWIANKSIYLLAIIQFDSAGPKPAAGCQMHAAEISALFRFTASGMIPFMISCLLRYVK